MMSDQTNDSKQVVDTKNAINSSDHRQPIPDTNSTTEDNDEIIISGSTSTTEAQSEHATMTQQQQQLQSELRDLLLQQHKERMKREIIDILGPPPGFIETESWKDIIKYTIMLFSVIGMLMFLFYYAVLTKRSSYHNNKVLLYKDYNSNNNNNNINFVPITENTYMNQESMMTGPSLKIEPTTIRSSLLNNDDKQSVHEQGDDEL